MGYLYLLTSLFAGATKGWCGKRTSGYVSEYKDAVLANFIRMIFCILIGFGMVAFSGQVGELAIGGKELLITLLSGIGNSAFVVLWLIAVRKGAYMMLDVFCTIGILIPLVGCALMFNEAICLNHVVGLIVLLAAVCIMCSYNNSIKTKLTVSSFVLLLLCGAANGISDFSQKLFVNLAADVPIAVFNFYTYLFSAVILFVLFSVSKAQSDGKVIIKKIFPYIVVMSICLFLNSYFKTLAAKFLSSAQLYPLAQGGALTLSSIMSAVFFKEKLTAKCIIGIVLSFAALIIINVLHF